MRFGFANRGFEQSPLFVITSTSSIAIPLLVVLHESWFSGWERRFVPDSSKGESKMTKTPLGRSRVAF